MAIAPLNKFLTVAVPVAPGEQTVYKTPTGVSAIVLYASVSNVGAATTYPTVTFTHRRTSTSTKTSGNIRNIRVIKDVEVPPNDSLVIIDGRLVLEKTAIVQDSVVIEGIQSGVGTITNVDYDNQSGIATVRTLSPHGFSVNDEITMNNIKFDCGGYSGGITTSFFPTPQRSFTVTAIDDIEKFQVDAGVVNNIPHTYQPADHNFIKSEANSITVTTGVGGPFTPTGGSYVPDTGILTLSFDAAHGLSNGNEIQITDNSLSFTCSMDKHRSIHTYPRPTDPASGQDLVVANVTANTFTVDVGISSSGGQIAPLQMEFIMSILENSTS